MVCSTFTLSEATSHCGISRLDLSQETSMIRPESANKNDNNLLPSFFMTTFFKVSIHFNVCPIISFNRPEVEKTWFPVQALTDVPDL